MDRRKALGSIAKITALGFGAGKAGAAVLNSQTVPPVGAAADALPRVFKGGPAVLNAVEQRLVAAIFDRLIPADELGMSASEAGCVEFLDRQLAGPFGQAASLYRLGPYQDGTPQQGPQMKQTPAERYRLGLAGLDAYTQARHARSFVDLDGDRQDEVLHLMEGGKVSFPGTDAQEFFSLLLQNVREGYLSDPIYGGNKDMVGWRMVGFPGARYDYRPWMHKKGQPLSIEPISLLGRTKGDKA